MSCRPVVIPVVAAFALTAVACGSSPEQKAEAPASTAAPAADASHDGHTGGRVFFKAPANGATVKAGLVQFEFAAEMFTIAAVPPGEVTTVRPGTGHFHLGTDTDCLPVGEIIPKASPWVHFGDGKSVIEMQLEPGQHKFAVQAGDDKHATMAGLCETISITVTK